MAQVERLVVKIGSSSLTDRHHRLDRRVLRPLVDDVVALRERGLQVVLVTSGAVAAGMGRLALTARPSAIGELQAMAAVGQNLLMHTYDSLFRRHDVPIGQVLLTEEDILEDRRRYLNLKNTFRRLFSYGAVPIINENDSVAVAELKRTIGDNDMLAAYVASLIQAQLLVILSDVEGLYAAYGPTGPRGELLGDVAWDDPRLEGAIGRGPGKVGRGGMETKLRAARIMMECGEMALIAHARRHRLRALLDGANLGTLFLPAHKRLRSRKRWIGFASPCRGSLVVDRGAERALVAGGKSLLPAGVTACQGDFAAGDVVRVDDEQGSELARGVSRYAAAELRRVLGKSSPEVARILGRPALEVIHRDDLVLFERVSPRGDGRPPG
jgi:glutamate 5-kinase